MDSTTTSTSTSYTINYGNEVKYGWVCPLCGKANAPWVSQCPCKPITVLKTSDSANLDLLKTIAHTWNEVYG